jgi:2-C-methyl-D-erythritol 4-phosphate cytidylyltransferase/2-C-methyl-D-erythritol 2,4-cyclodiphosphate synthase
MTSVAILVVAAGRGTRADTGALPKQYVSISGRPVLAWTLDSVLASERVQTGLVVIHPTDQHHYDASAQLARFRAKLIDAAHGGPDRQRSVLNGLEALVHVAPTIVLIHDAARPFVTVAQIERLLEALTTCSAAILASPVTDTIKRADPARPLVCETVPRQHLWKAETPQGFRFEQILAAHRRAAASNRTDFTDDASIAEWAGLPVSLVDSGSGNDKITTADDVALAKLRFAARTRST